MNAIGVLMIDLNFWMPPKGDVLDVANDRHGGYTDLENGAFQETPHASSGLGLMMGFKRG